MRAFDAKLHKVDAASEAHASKKALDQAPRFHPARAAGAATKDPSGDSKLRPASDALLRALARNCSQARSVAFKAQDAATRHVRRRVLS